MCYFNKNGIDVFFKYVLIFYITVVGFIYIKSIPLISVEDTRKTLSVYERENQNLICRSMSCPYLLSYSKFCQKKKKKFAPTP